MAKLNVKNVAENKLLWENFKPKFSDKGSNSTKITLVEKVEIVTYEKKVANIVNQHFDSIAKS